ncbi:MAG: ribose transport system ATP-binding protein, partial [Alphaproteobacteria bacterium]|nr:ribose transport system ATP-binding protein [Alphaproteobacteria bacterium]
LGIASVSQELSIVTQLSVLDNIWLGHRDVPFFHRAAKLRRRAEEVLELVDLAPSLDAPAATLSLAERQLLEIARMLVREARILILDEPTATLADREIERVLAALRRLRSQNKAAVFITHRLSEVFEICDSVTVLRNGEEVGTHRTADMDRPRLIELMLGRPLEQMYPGSSGRSGDIALSVRNLTVPGTVHGLTFDLRQGEITCLAGQIGSGAIDALRALAGLVYDATGDVVIAGKRLQLGSVPRALSHNLRFVSEDRAAEGVFRKLSVQENLLATQLEKLGGFGWLSRRRLANSAKRMAGAVRVDAARMRNLAGELSGGNQQKIAVGRSITSLGEGVLLMNEPTRGVDVGARAEIYALMRQLCDNGYAILMTSTDIEEIVGMSDHVITMFRGAKIRQHEKGDIHRRDIVADITYHRVAEAS